MLSPANRAALRTIGMSFSLILTVMIPLFMV